MTQPTPVADLLDRLSAPAVIGTTHVRTCRDCLALALQATETAEATGRPTATAQHHGHGCTVQVALVDMVPVRDLARSIFDRPDHVNPEGMLRGWEPDLLPLGVGAIPADDATEVLRRVREDWPARVAARRERVEPGEGNRFD